MAMLICRSLVGDPYIVQDPGDALASATFCFGVGEVFSFCAWETTGLHMKEFGVKRNHKYWPCGTWQLVPDTAHSKS